MPTPHKPRLREQPISRIFPNMITLAGMCCGLSAIRFAIGERWELAVAFIIAAAIIDGMDGRVARLLGATSEFGAQLDSLSDFVCFGVAPALVMYIWLLHDIRGIGWAVTLFYVICAALRLARFNTALTNTPKYPWSNQFFTGVPSPAGGILCLLPMIFFLQIGEELQLTPALVAVHVVMVGALMASRLPTFAGKNLRIPHEHILPFMIGASFLMVLLIIEPWLMISVFGIAYIVSIYFSMRRYRKLARADEGK
ncbi:MAG: CDP-diacylglycerol--serine O-phosphatidyltransferase [Alphaproteobacteria bacterium]|nr:CDP-diacylglycerol--serine O-phosphatidyltransferase [Alphaproteobacteria bacterium]